MNKPYDLAIVGAGILGTFAAIHAINKGLNVVWIEAGSTPRGATVRNFGQVVPSGQSLSGWRQLGIRSLALYKQQIEAYQLPAQNQGSLYLASNESEANLLEEMSAIDRDMGYNSEIWRPEQCIAKNPCIKKEYVRLGLFYPQEINIDSALFLPKLISHTANSEKIDYLNQTSVVQLAASENQTTLVLSDGQKLQATQCLVCCGHQLNRLLPLASCDELIISRLQMLGSKALPAGTIKGNLLTGLSIRRYEAFRSCESFSTLETTEQQQILEDEGIHILVKQSDNGELIIGDSHQYYPASESDSLDFYIDERVNQLMLNELCRIVELPNLEINRRWNGYYSQENSCGVFAKTWEKNIHVVTGIGGKGMSTGPGFMEKVIERIKDHQPIDAREILSSVDNIQEYSL